METTNSSTIKSILVGLLLVSSLQITAQSKKDNMTIQTNQPAPSFTIKDVNGKDISLSDFKGKKILLTFYRNVGCPICNLRFHELQLHSDYFTAKGLTLIAVYESTAENMKQYLENEKFNAIMIPNSDLSLYNLYSIENSIWKMTKGMFNGAMGKMNDGKKLFKKDIEQDGNTFRISADFLIDEKGNIQTAYYGKFIGDHLPIDDINKFLN